MDKTETKKYYYPNLDKYLHYCTFGQRMRQIRKSRGLSQDEFAAMLGTSKQILSRYELEQRSPRIDQVSRYAEKLGVSVDYLLGDDDAEADSSFLCDGLRGKPFFEVFGEVISELNLTVEELVRITGLTEQQLKAIFIREMKDAPLPIAMRLSETLNVPLEVWAGGKAFVPAELSTAAHEVARAYETATLKDKNTARLALNLELVKEETI